MLGVVCLWLIVNPIIFRAPVSTSSWMTRGVRGEQMWVRHRRWGFEIFLAILLVPLFVASLITAYHRLLWPTVYCATLVAVFKFWFIDRMVRLYELSVKGECDGDHAEQSEAALHEGRVAVVDREHPQGD